MLKNRFLVQIILMFLIGIAGATIFSVPALSVYAIFIFGISTILFTFYCYRKQKIKFKYFFIVFLFFALIVGYTHSSLSISNKYIEKPSDDVVIKGFICEKTNKYIDIKTISGSLPKGTKIRIYNIEKDENDVILPFYEGDFNLKISDCPKYIKANGISFYGKGNVSNLSYSKGHLISKSLYKTRTFLSKNVDKTFSQSEETSSFINALILGETANISDELYDDYGRLGITHVISISGMHFTILIMSLFNFLKLFRLNIKTRSIICIPVSIFYCFLSGASPSSVRAMIMIIIFLFGRAILWKMDSITSLFIAAGIICSFNPYSFYSVGFILSFVATFAIFISPSFLNIKDLYHKPKIIKKANNLIQSVFITLIISLLLSPILINRFQIFSLITPLANVLLGIFFPPIMYLSLFSVLISCFGMPNFITEFITFIIEGFHTIISKMADIPNIAIVPRKELSYIFIILISVCVFSAFFIKKKAREIAIKCFVILFAVTACIYVFTDNINTHKYNSLNFTQNGASCFLTHDGKKYFIVENENYLDRDFIISNHSLDIDVLIISKIEDEEKALNKISDFTSLCKVKTIYSDPIFEYSDTKISPIDSININDLYIQKNKGMNIFYDGDKSIIWMGNNANMENKNTFADIVIISENFFDNIRNFLSLPKNIKEIYIPEKFKDEQFLNYIKRNYKNTDILLIQNLNFKYKN